jgi:hypothetical protein
MMINMKENKKRMEITLDNYTYKYLKEKKINASKLIRQLLRVALFTASANDTNVTNSTLNNPLGKVKYIRYIYKCIYN